MDITVLNTNFEPVKVVDTFESFIWTDRYSECGDFELYCYMDPALLEYLRQDYYLWINDSEHLMIIEELGIDSDTENGNHLKVTGRSLESILDRRIIWGEKIFAGSLQDAVKTMLEENVISPSIEERKISNFIFEESSDPKITNMIIDAQYTGDDLYSAIKSLCEKNKIGFKIVLNDNNQFVFSLYAGIDRTYTQSDNPYVVFSPKYDNVINSNYFMSVTNYKNVALIAGEGDHWTARKTAIVGEATELNRREIFVDGSSVSSEVDGVTVSNAEYIARLEKKGRDDLREHELTVAFEGEMDTVHMYKYGEDFFMGDIVQVVNEYGQEGEAYISELIVCQDETGLSLYPTFKSINEKLDNLSKFHISCNGSVYMYVFVKGWTWTDFVNSQYNDGNITIVNGELKFKAVNAIIGQKPDKILIGERFYRANPHIYIYQPGYTEFKFPYELGKFDDGVYTEHVSCNFTEDNVQISIKDGEYGEYTSHGYVVFDAPSDFYEYGRYSKLVFRGVNIGTSETVEVGYSVFWSFIDEEYFWNNKKGTVVSNKDAGNSGNMFVGRDDEIGEDICAFDIGALGSEYKFIFIRIDINRQEPVIITEIYIEE